MMTEVRFVRKRKIRSSAATKRGARSRTIKGRKTLGKGTKRLAKGRIKRRLKKTAQLPASYDKAYNEGFDSAYNEGFDIGYKEGMEAGQEAVKGA
jgi:hypothetical protein